MIKLIDTLLNEVDLKFDFTAYGVLACSKDDGIMEFVPSDPIQNIGLEFNYDVSKYLEKLYKEFPERKGEILQTYLRSNAGYAVATYILAIGDRHLENLMLTKRGNLFHLDFGFILGR